MRISFQLKLMLIMTAIVVASTWIVLSSMRRELQNVSAEAYEQRFLAQVDNYLAVQRTRLTAVATWSANAAESEFIQSALKASHAEGQSDFLRDLSREVGMPGSPRRPESTGDRPENNEGGARPEGLGLGGRMASQVGGRNGMVVYLVDHEGQVLEGPKGRSEEERRKRLRHFKDIAEGQRFADQEFGVYLTDEVDEKGTATAIEVVATPVFDSEDNQLLGGLLVGLPLTSSSGRFWKRVDEEAGRQSLTTGLFVDGVLISDSIPASVARELELRLSQEIASGTRGISHLPISVEGEDHDVHFTALNPNSTLPVAYHVALFPLEELYGDLAVLQRNTAIFGAMVLAVALSMTWFVSRRMTVPIRQLVGGTKAIAGGDYETTVPVKTHDEIGELAASFNVMTAELRLKEKYRSILDKVTDKAVAHELMRGELELGGEVREITVLFSDIRGFTALTEGMPPREIVELLNEHMSVMTDLVHEHNGVVDKFVGDMVMAVFGAPKSYGDDALNAVRCAAQMMRERDRLNAETGRTLEMGIGIASGEVLAGCMGSRDRLNYTVLGERVNLASRLCHEAKGHEVLMDQTTVERVRDDVQVKTVDAVNLKGFSQPVPAYRLDHVQAIQGTEDPGDESISGAQLAGA